MLSWFWIAIAATYGTLAHGSPAAGDSSAFKNTGSAITLIYQNNLNATDDPNHISALILDSVRQNDAAKACAALNERPLSKKDLVAYKNDFVRSLSYQALSGSASPGQRYIIEGGLVALSPNFNDLVFPRVPSGYQSLPALCSQSANSTDPNAPSTAKDQISIASGGNTYVGYRNKKSFRFLGIPYADPPQRWVYSKPYSGKGQTIQATKYGSKCVQSGSGNEDCLFLNIQTPRIPKADSNKGLRPVMFWIHGGGFTGGTGNDAGTDGANLASREDIVVVTINYRLSTLGFLAIPGTDIKGNYGIADQINALDWVVKNIANFGGDPKKITIGGDSAGAGSVRTLLGSPPAIGKFQGAVAVSNLGGGKTLGLNGDYGTTYSSYYTIEQSYNVAGQNIFQAAGCNQADLNEQIACLKHLPTAQLQTLPVVARYVVQDGTVVNTQQLIVSKRNASTAHINVMFGVTANDGASFSTYPKTPVKTKAEGIAAALGISAAYAQQVVDSGLFPYYDTGNITLDSFNVSQRIATDKTFRCIDQATVYAGARTGAFSSAYYFQFDRTSGGYDPNNLGGPPNNDPSRPYFRYHSGGTGFFFGNIPPLRDANDLYATQLESGYFAEFVRSGQPNPRADYLRVRGYDKTLEAVRRTGAWPRVGGEKGPIRYLDYPGRTGGFVDVPQCAFLNYTLDYYLKGGN